ncbi:protocadherin-15-like [Sinocyclocheilus grahami]|uniref:protocadherin-15-like n=1 Tax=Sinocyclocheilus grahami TaxID=75366 RepID=UPI0007ACB489|nr:PREDICTED: protocadherin-15-like [Sinocyclocheilus grahami]
MPPLMTQALMPVIPPLFPPSYSVPGIAPSMSVPPQAVPATTFPLPLARSSFSLSSATPLPTPPNALALEPPPVASNIRTQILAEIQNVGTRGGSSSNPRPYNPT